MKLFGPDIGVAERDKLRLVLEAPGKDHFVVVKFFGAKALTVKFWLKSYQSVGDARLHWASTPVELHWPTDKLVPLVIAAREAIRAAGVTDWALYL